MFKKIHFNAHNYKFKHNHRRRYHTNHSYSWGKFQEEHKLEENTVDTKIQDYKDECLEVLDLIFQHKNGKPLTRPFTDNPNNKQKSQNVSVKHYAEECKRILEDINKTSDTRPNDTISRSKRSINSNVYEDNFVGGSKQRQNIPEITGTNNENVPQVKTDSSPILDKNVNKNEKPTHRYRITQSSKPGSISKRRVIINPVKRLKVNNTQTKSKPQPIKLTNTKSSFNFNNGENMLTCPQPIESKTMINCNCKSSSSDDDDEADKIRVRVNRRLQSEKPSISHNSKTVTCHHAFCVCTPTRNIISQTANQLQSASRPLKSSLVIPKTPKPLKELWNSENKDVLNMTFEEVLEEPIFFENSDDVNNYGETLYERMFTNKLKEPNGRLLISQFYIPPALVEVFYQKFTDDLTSQECLRQVCLARKWPEPVYTQNQQSGPNQFLYSCTLKSVKFVPAKFGSNNHLAKELAASYCLRWLGLKQRKIDTKFSEFVVETYFNDMLYRHQPKAKMFFHI